MSSSAKQPLVPHDRVDPLVVTPGPRFVGKLSPDWHDEHGYDDGRTMILDDELHFIDSNGKVWSARKGDRINGGSIPRICWRLFTPYVGKYRRSTVIHDVYCQRRTESAAATHKAFLEGMLCDGVPWFTARAFYLAVLIGGPRWEVSTNE